MARIISVHEYDLTPGSGPAQFEQAIRAAEGRGLFDLPGLIAHHFMRGAKGARNGAYAAVWDYESREAWERLWGDCGATTSTSGVSREVADLGGRADGAHPEQPSGRNQVYDVRRTRLGCLDAPTRSARSRGPRSLSSPACRHPHRPE
jgi:hypothetical protein